MRKPIFLLAVAALWMSPGAPPLHAQARLESVQAAMTDDVLEAVNTWSGLKGTHVSPPVVERVVQQSIERYYSAYASAMENAKAPAGRSPTKSFAASVEVMGRVVGASRSSLPETGRDLAQDKPRDQTPKTRLASFAFFALNKFPTVRLVIDPNPPRDYQVSINGNNLPPNDRDLYLVPTGQTAITVSRANKKACKQVIQLDKAKTYDVSCKF